MLKQIVGVALLIGSVPAVAQSNDTATRAKDPNRKICETVEETGTRLGAKRICMTAAQWEQQRRNDRESVERAQRGTGIQASN